MEWWHYSLLFVLCLVLSVVSWGYDELAPTSGVGAWIHTAVTILAPIGMFAFFILGVVTKWFP